MNRYRRKRTKFGGVTGFKTRGPIVGLMSQVIGGAFMLFALILFGIGLSQIDTSYTSAATYAGMVGLTETMGLAPMLMLLLFAGVGVSVAAGGAIYSFKMTKSGGWLDAFLGFAMGAVGLVIALILSDLNLSQLQTQMVAINATTNLANFSGVYDISTIFGILIWLGLFGSGASGIIAAGWNAFSNIKKGF